MKKNFSILIISIYICIFISNAYAESIVKFNENIDCPMGEKIENDSVTAQINYIDGIPYIYNKWGANSNPVVYDENLSVITGLDYVETEQYYLARDCSESQGFWGYFPNNKMMIYDKNLILIHKEDFGGGVYVTKVGYSEGEFYATYREKYKISKDDEGVEKIQRVLGNKSVGIGENERFVTVKSTDMVNWKETDEDMPQSNRVSTIQNSKSDVTGKMSMVTYENKVNNNFETKLGDWFVMSEKNNVGYIENICISRDNVYFVKYELKDFKIQDIYNMYEYGEEIVFQGGVSGGIRGGYFSFDKQEAYKKLHDIEYPIYIRCNNKILGFEEIPIIENDRTLVPMRFLFEQMGADVDWNNETQTATATMNNTAITFSIDDTEANVDNTPVTMEVPARLVNGKTMVPLRFLSEEMGYSVTWDDNTRTAIIE